MCRGVGEGWAWQTYTTTASPSCPMCSAQARNPRVARTLRNMHPHELASVGLQAVLRRAEPRLVVPPSRPLVSPAEALAAAAAAEDGTAPRSRSRVSYVRSVASRQAARHSRRTSPSGSSGAGGGGADAGSKGGAGDGLTTTSVLLAEGSSLLEVGAGAGSVGSVPPAATSPPSVFRRFVGLPKGPRPGSQTGEGWLFPRSEEKGDGVCCG